MSSSETGLSEPEGVFEPTYSNEYHRSQVIERACKQARGSGWFYCIYFVMIILATFVLIWEIAADEGAEDNLAVFHIEMFINLVLVVEIPVGVLVQGGCKRYWSERWNIIDAVITMVCTFLFVFLVVYHKRYLLYFGDEVKKNQTERVAAGDVPSFVDSILLVVRYFLQLLRLLLIIRRSRHALQLRQQMTTVDLVESLSDVDEEEGEGDGQGKEGWRKEANEDTQKEGDSLLM